MKVYRVHEWSFVPMGQRWCTPGDRKMWSKCCGNRRGIPSSGDSQRWCRALHTSWLDKGMGGVQKELGRGKAGASWGVMEGPAAWKTVHSSVTWSEILTGCRASFLGSDSSSFMDIFSSFLCVSPLFPVFYLNWVKQVLQQLPEKGCVEGVSLKSGMSL